MLALQICLDSDAILLVKTMLHFARLIDVHNMLRRCEALSLKFQQKDLDTAAWDEVQTGQQMDYAFDEPLLPHKIRVVLSDNGFLDQSGHDYPLDIIKVCSVISQLSLGRVCLRFFCRPFPIFYHSSVCVSSHLSCRPTQ